MLNELKNLIINYPKESQNVFKLNNLQLYTQYTKMNNCIIYYLYM